MNHFVYIITEGVQDVVFLTLVLRQAFGLKLIEKQSELPQEAATWLTNFKWPVGGDIARRAVPAPSFVGGDGVFVAIRNAQGLSNISKVMAVDDEVFLRLQWAPSAVAVVLDADDEEPALRFAGIAKLLVQLQWPKPERLEVIAQSSGKRAGVFSFPGAGRSGTLEDVLVPLGNRRFPELARHADDYVTQWMTDAVRTQGADFKLLRKPSGPKKAVLSAMVALLKPTKGLVPSLEDQHWLPASLNEAAELIPLLEFLTRLLEVPLVEQISNEPQPTGEPA